MDPVTNKILQGVPYAGMGSTLERNALIGVIRNLISQDRYNVDYILNYAESVGYQRQMAEDVFKELTGLSPKLIVNNNAYFDMPSYVPNMCIAWGISKSNKEKAFYIVPFEYGYAVMEKDEVNAPIPTVISATIPEAFDELKKVAKGIQTLDKIITKKLLETEEVPTDAKDVNQVNLPYAASPLQILKKNFKDKVLSVSEFERQASKLLASEEITVDEAEDLMAWKQDLIDEDETYGNDVLELDEQWKPLNAEVDDDDFNGYHSSEEYLNSYEYLYETLVNGNITLYKEKLNKLSKSELMDYIAWAEEMGIGREELKLNYITASKKASKKIKSSGNFTRQPGYPLVFITEDDEEIYPKEQFVDEWNEDHPEEPIGEWDEQDNAYFDWLDQHYDVLQSEMEDFLYKTKLPQGVRITIKPGKDFSGGAQLWVEGNPTDKSKVIKVLTDAANTCGWKIDNGNGKQAGIVPTKKITLEDGRTFTVRYNPNEKSITTVLDENGKETRVDAGTRLQLLRKLFHKGEPTIVESKKKNAGYSNNPDYFGDWFGKGQIDYSKIINPEDEGKIWMLKIWGGSGYILDVYLVKANDYEDAIDKVFDWSYENEGANEIIFDYDYLSERCHEDYESEWFYGKDEGKPSDKMSYEDFEDEWMSDWVSNSNYDLFARSENFFIDELPEEYTNKKQSSSKKADKNNSNLNDSIKEWYTKTYKTDEFGADINPNTTFMEVLSDAENAYDLIGVTDSVVRERVFDELSKRTNIPYEKIFNMWMGKQASKKVTAENMTLDDIEAEDNKDQVQEEIEKIDETPAEDIFTESTPEDYLDKALQEDKVDTINDVVSKCIDKFSEKFKDFDKYQVKILSYNTKVLGDDKPVQEEMVEDKELNANAILQVILQITNNAEEANIKKVLAVFSITNGELHWTGTVRGENDQVVAFTEEGLDALFEVNEPSEDELEDII